MLCTILLLIRALALSLGFLADLSRAGATLHVTPHVLSNRANFQDNPQEGTKAVPQVWHFLPFGHVSKALNKWYCQPLVMGPHAGLGVCCYCCPSISLSLSQSLHLSLFPTGTALQWLWVGGTVDVHVPPP